jgi:hypothetical protein
LFCINETANVSAAGILPAPTLSLSSIAKAFEIKQDFLTIASYGNFWY